MTAKVMQLARADDPKQAILKNVGDLSNVHLFSARVLVGIYIAPEKTAGGIIRIADTVKEDVYQGVVGLVLKKGKTAFCDDDRNKFQGQDVQLGEWVTFRPGDAKRIQINEVDCRIVEDTSIDMVIDAPDMITHK